MSKLTIDEIRDKYNAGGYTTKLPFNSTRVFKEGYVFDENKSVKWNKEEVVRQNQIAKNANIAYREDQSRLDKQLTEDVVDALMENNGFAMAVARKVEAYIYTEKHSYMCDYFSALDEFGDFIEEIINLHDAAHKQ